MSDRNLKELLVNLASDRPLHLHEFVTSALHSGYQPDGKVTEKINRTLKRLVREGVMHKDEENKTFKTQKSTCPDWR